MRLGEVVKTARHPLDVAKVLRCQATALVLVDQHNLRAGGILRESSFQELLADHAREIRWEVPDIVVLGDLIPARSDRTQRDGQDEPSQNDQPGLTDHHP